MSALRAIVFDLYGTLVHLRDLSFQRLAPRLVGADRRSWVEFLRGDLLVRPYASHDALIDEVVARFAPAGGDELRAALRELLERELAAVEPEPALRSVLGFLARRGLELGLLTNSASPYREPFERLVGSERFRHVAFSCDLGVRKPEPASYETVLAQLGRRPEEVAMVGDSLPNDVEAPAKLGMTPVYVGRSSLHLSLERFGDLAWLAGFERGELETLLPPFRRVALGELSGAIGQVELLPDAVQGRYNLVARAEVAWDGGFTESLFLKRYRHPEAIAVEQLARALLTEVGIDTNRVAVLEGAEPLLVSREVTGRRLLADEPRTPELVFEVGRHGASAWLFGNADYRPRNAFLSEATGRPRLTMVDYEYMLFDRALDLSDLPERFDPVALARHSDADLLARGSRRTLTRATMKRCRREFFESRNAEPELLAAFRAGWHEVSLAAQRAAPKLEELVRARLAASPPLVIGTEAYRRAFLPLDVADLLERVAADPDATCDLCF